MDRLLKQSMKFYQKLENIFFTTRLVVEGVNLDIPWRREVASSGLASSNSSSRCSVSRSEYPVNFSQKECY